MSLALVCPFVKLPVSGAVLKAHVLNMKCARGRQGEVQNNERKVNRGHTVESLMVDSL